MSVRARQLNQFFTKPHVVRTCLATLAAQLGPLYDTCHFIEPACGLGAFVAQLPQERTEAYEIDEATANACAKKYPCLALTCLDFLTLPATTTPDKDMVIVGNPPFGKTLSRSRGGGQNLALAFLNHACSLGDTVAFILGANFNRPTILDLVDPTMDLVVNDSVPRGSFDVCIDAEGTLVTKKGTLNCVFQIWRRRPSGSGLRAQLRRADAPKQPPQGLPTSFELVKPTDESTNVILRKWGSVGQIGRILASGHAQCAPFVAKARELEAKRKTKYGKPGYTLARGGLTAWHLCVPDENLDAVLRLLADKLPAMRAFVARLTAGNNPSLSQHDLVEILYK